MPSSIKEKRVQDIVEWREAMLTLPDKKFFAMMSFYLGKIETPFNKQTLVENLSAFLRKETIQQKIFLRIDYAESYVIAAINGLPQATFELLQQLFKHDYNHYQMRDLLANLEQRLIIFYSEKTKSYKVNPYLQSIVSDFASPEIFLLPLEKCPEKTTENLINSINIVAAYSFFLHNPNAVKNNGELRKKTQERIQKIFLTYNGNAIAFNFLLRAFLNLSLFSVADGLLVENTENWKAFSKLSLLEMQCYLVIAASGHYTERYLLLYVKRFYNFFIKLQKDHVYECADLEKYFFIISEQLNSYFVPSEISAEPKDWELFFNDVMLKKTVIQIATMFGLFITDGSKISVNAHLNYSDENKTILVSPSFEVTLFPSARIDHLLPLVSAMNPVSIQTTALFEVTRNSTGLYFETKGCYTDLQKLFSKNIAGELPQNIEMSLHQWYQNFSSIRLYSGVVAAVSKEKSALFEKNMPLNKLVQAKLADGIFLLRVTDITMIKGELQNAGSECLLETTTLKRQTTANRVFSSFDITETEYAISIKSKKEYKKIINEHIPVVKAEQTRLHAQIKKLDLDKYEKDFLTDNINRNIIIDEDQLHSENIKFENVRVSALDYSAKIRLCEAAISKKHKLEISVDVKNEIKTFICIPVEIIRCENKDTLKLILVDSEKVKHLQIAKIVKLKVLKESIF